MPPSLFWIDSWCMFGQGVGLTAFLRSNTGSTFRSVRQQSPYQRRHKLIGSSYVLVFPSDSVPTKVDSGRKGHRDYSILSASKVCNSYTVFTSTHGHQVEQQNELPIGN